MKVDELSAAQRRELQRGHFRPAGARTVRAPRRPGVAVDATTSLFRCHTCPETFESWPRAEAHVDVSGHPRIDAILAP